MAHFKVLELCYVGVSLRQPGDVFESDDKTLRGSACLAECDENGDPVASRPAAKNKAKGTAEGDDPPLA